MRKRNQDYTTEQLVETVIFGMLEMKASEITTIDLRDIPNAVTSYFVICHGNSNTQVESIAESVGHQAQVKLNDNPVHVEGAGLAEWILLDYSDVVVHVFQEGSRKFYNLEGLWADAKITTINESVA
ncbi:MAG: ribosome silencing factor [Bacteroidales bacterium]|nr:ribosome silencing factor [Bacteroidales bacterium]